LVDEVVVVGREGSSTERLKFTPGGSSREESAALGLAASSGDIVLVHDGARPFVTQELITRVVEATADHGAVFPGIPVVDTVREYREGVWVTLDRSRLTRVQTPQGFRRDWLQDAYAGNQLPVATDDAVMVANVGHTLHLVEGDARNVKITHWGDLQVPSETRTGLGYDIHSFSTDADRPMWLGGVEFPDDKPGLEGHSDADALIHAVVDALFGAANMGDIGVHFPPSDPTWKNCPSLRFLRHAALLLRRENWNIVNIDSSVIAERPRVMRRQDEIRAAMADAAGVSVGQVSVKATTNEKLGAIGRAEGIAAFAVATITRPLG
jgi:2-C-methyl-D-erythritol 4-phosphate cytidylyltransferase/2-C-methyl-D-erythritol 2,4-cyclodiphosphate synthase